MSLSNLKILLVAYACEPYRGSEPAVGFYWSLALSEYLNITVLTRKNNQKIIEEFISKNNVNNINFIYFDIPILSKLKNYVPFGVKLYSFLWEYFSYLKIKRKRFDIIHRLTFVNLITINKFYKYCDNYINGFIGGGEQSPKNILDNYLLRYKILEKLRYKMNICLLNKKIIQNVYINSKLLVVVTDDTKKFISEKVHSNNIVIVPAIFSKNTVNENESYNSKSNFRLLYTGRLIYWKNVDILIKAMHQLKKNGYKFNLSIIGDGIEKSRLKILSKNLGVTDLISFKNKMNQSLLFEEFKMHSLFLFSSSHDSGGMVIIESIELNIPVLFLDTGGPKEIFKGIDYPLKVNPDQSYENIINDFSNKIIWTYNNYDEFMLIFKDVRKKILYNHNIKNKAQDIIKLYNKYIYESTLNS